MPIPYARVPKASKSDGVLDSGSVGLKRTRPRSAILNSQSYGDVPVPLTTKILAGLMS